MCHCYLLRTSSCGQLTIGKVFLSPSAREAVKALLDDTNTYEKLTSNPTGSIKNKLIQTLRNWRKEGKIPGYLYNQLYPTAENVPKFYGLPKIHKKDAPLRPIVSSIGSVMYDTAKFLAKIMKPLVGLNGHHIVNSEDFVNKIAELEVPPGQKLVSYDVSALFTSIPINEAISVTKTKLEGDSSLPDRCPLDITQLSTLLEMCLSSTYFTYQHEFYKQKQGAAMGSPISPIVANLYMEQFESRALNTAPTPPTMWYRYVDDTMAKIHEHAVDSFSDHLNSIDQHIQFTSEQEKEGKIPFLDTCVHVNQDGSTKISVYRKSTHTDQYLNFNSNHHLQHKRAVVNTLMLRAQTLVTEDEDKTREAQHVKQALKVNNYPDWMLTIPHSKSGTKEPENEKKIYASAPYIKGISERLQRAFKSHEVTLIHKPVNSLRSQLVHVKDKTSNLKKCGTVYQVQCEQCNKEYVGETSRLLETRMKEHQSRNSSAIHEHCRLEGHSVDTSKTKVLATEINTFKRRVKEAIEIKLRKPLLNRDNGFELAPIYDRILTPPRQ
ncbi:hypothetical protein ACROYT_G001002 [Oculina patagonica]